MGYCAQKQGFVNMVSIGPDLDICEFCGSTMEEWSYPVYPDDFYPYMHYMHDNDTFEWEAYDFSSAA